MAEKKTMRDYIMGNQERTTPKRKTLGEYFIESKLDAIKRQLEALASSFCDHCYLDGHESEECPIRNLWDDCEIVHSDQQHNPHPPNWDINYIPPCLRRTPPKQAEEPNINEKRTTLRQSTITELFQRYQDSISTHIQPKFESEAEVNLLTSGVDLNEDLTHDRQVPTESEQALTEESTYKGHNQDLVVVDMEKSKESPTTLGLTIGYVIIEVRKGKVSLRCGKEEDALKALNYVENFSHFISSTFDNLVVTNNFSDLRMQAPMEKISIVLDFSIMVNVIGEAIESICALFSHKQFGGEWTPHHLYQKFMEFLPNQRKKKDDVVSISFWPP
ncbi:hypothetical protein QL285_068566 [Trifolium repens]|nr:hypothetical protein QL285_068566 [Trifolium repens]